MFWYLQLPYAHCNLPPEATMLEARRLCSESKIGFLQSAQAACAHAGQDRNDCIGDVIPTGDLFCS